MKFSVEVGLLSSTPLIELERKREFLEILASSDSLILPDRYGADEPINLDFDPSKLSEALEIWDWNILWKKNRGVLQGSAWANHAVHSTVYLSISPGVFDIGSTLAFMKSFIGRFGADIAYIHLPCDADLQNLDFYKIHIMPFDRGLTTHALKDGIPDFCWAMYFGKPYRNFFENELLSTQAFLVEDDGTGVYVQLTESVHDRAQNRVAFLAAQAAAKEHLGTDAFISTDGSRKCRVPVFGAGIAD